MSSIKKEVSLIAGMIFQRWQNDLKFEVGKWKDNLGGQDDELG